MAPTPKRIGRAIRNISSKAVPNRATRVTGSAAGTRNTSPLAGEKPFVILRVQIQSGRDLVAKDKSGKSDPYAALRASPILYNTLTASCVR